MAGASPDAADGGGEVFKLDDGAMGGFANGPAVGREDPTLGGARKADVVLDAIKDDEVDASQACRLFELGGDRSPAATREAISSPIDFSETSRRSEGLAISSESVGSVVLGFPLLPLAV